MTINTNYMRKLMEAVQLNEYLMQEDDSITELLNLNVFGDTGHREDGIVYGPNDVSWEEGELDPYLQKDWMRKVKPYAKQAGLLKREIMKAAKAGRTLSLAEVEAAENTWYDGSDAYSDLEMGYEELPELWDAQLEVVLEILEGAIEDEEGDYAPFGEQVEEEVITEYSEDDNVVEELEYLQEQMLDLLSQAENIVRGTSEEGPAKAYWLAHIETALTNSHGYLGGSMTTMEDTIDALRQSGDDDRLEDDDIDMERGF